MPNYIEYDTHDILESHNACTMTSVKSAHVLQCSLLQSVLPTTVNHVATSDIQH
jgi:hypothetical protein